MFGLKTKMDKDNRIYKFYDCDPFTQQTDYDICGKDYETLIDVCRRYCETVSLSYESSRIQYPLEERLEPHRVTPVLPFQFKNGYYTHATGKRKYYKLCSEVVSVLLEAKGLFEWIYGWGFENPTDLVFYRKDGSVFFDSFIHEGECVLLPLPTEDVSDLLKIGPWFTPEQDPRQT
jgi:hypothetical protein